MFYENEHQKYTCPHTGAHFEVKDLCRRLNIIKQDREKADPVTSSKTGGSNDY